MSEDNLRKKNNQMQKAFEASRRKRPSMLLGMVLGALAITPEPQMPRSNHKCQTPPVKNPAAFTPKASRKKDNLTRKQRKALKAK